MKKPIFDDQLLWKQTQGTTVTSSHQQAAFPIAAIIVSIWQLFPDVGKLFLALLYIECPFFVPYFVPQQPGQSESEYFRYVNWNLCMSLK